MIVVVGAGAAGLVAAIFAASSGTSVTLIEKTRDAGRKILISGGGRCNILPEVIDPRRFETRSSVAVVRRVLRSWPLQDQIAFFERDVGVPLKLEQPAGKYFPVSNRARDVRDGLVNLARTTGVTLQFGTDVTGVEPGDTGWIVRTNAGDLAAARVILATGGLSVPNTGSTGVGLEIATALQHKVHRTFPALTPLTADPAPHADLTGLSLDVRIRARWQDLGGQARGGFLFTHQGYSGPAVLDVSHVAVQSRLEDERATVRVSWADLTPEDWDASLQHADGLVVSALSKRVPQRLAERLIRESGIPRDQWIRTLRRPDRLGLIKNLTAYELPWSGDEGYRKAEVTGGGVALEDVRPATLESRRHRGLFLCGEMLDAFGPIGGHNFAWAWASGRLAGLGAGKA